MKSVIEQIQEFDPSYNPIEKARIEAGIEKETLDTAVNRVWFDGYYGPVSAEEWAESHDSVPLTVSEALDTLAKVAENVEDYWDKDDDQFGFDYNSRVDSYDIVKAAWPFLTEIYGGLPF